MFSLLRKGVAATAIAVLAATSASAVEAPAKVTVHETLFRKVTSKMLPLIIDAAKSVTIPGESTSHYDFDPIRLSEFNIGSFNIGFAGPDKIVVSLRDLSMAIPNTHFKVKDRIGGWIHIDVHCSGDFYANVANTNVGLTVALGRDGAGRLVSRGVEASVDFGSLSVGHRMTHDFCKVADHIIADFLLHINHRIEDMIKSKIGPIMQSKASQAVAGALAKVPLRIDAAPVMTGAGMTLSIDILSSISRQVIAEASEVARPPLAVGGFASRDLEVIVPASSVNVLAQVAEREGFFKHVCHTSKTTAVFKSLLPGAYALCPDCRMELPWALREAPSMRIDNRIAFSARNAEVTVDAFHPNGTKITLFSLEGNFTGSAGGFSASGSRRNVLHFKLAVPTLKFDVLSSVVPILTTATVDALSSFAVNDVVLPAVNTYLSADGIPMPKFGGQTPEQVAVDFQGNAAEFGLNVDVTI